MTARKALSHKDPTLPLGKQLGLGCETIKTITRATKDGCRHLVPNRANASLSPEEGPKKGFSAKALLD